jgi:GT2 family glycosyltransferase
MEETDLCKRAREDKLKIIYTPFAVVWHQIPPSRVKLGWMAKRVYYGGINRGLVGGRPVPYKTKSNVISIYDCVFLMVFIIPYLLGIVRGVLMRKVIFDIGMEEYT